MTALFAFVRILWQLKWVFLAVGVVWGAVHWHQKAARETINAAVYEGVYRHVYALEEKRVKQELADAEAAKLRAIEREKVAEKVVTKYVDRIKYVKGKTVETVKEIYVQVPADACPIHGSFRLFHDYAAVQAGPVPDAASGIDAAPVPVAETAETVVENYGICHETGERLTALQDWVTQQSQVY